MREKKERRKKGKNKEKKKIRKVKYYLAKRSTHG